jgi:hypothetical protein
MTEPQIRTLLLFLSRTQMYIAEENKESIIAFIHGFEAGCGFNLFTESLSKRLELIYKVKKRALGWSHQIEMYAKKKSTGWEEAFKSIAKEVLEEYCKQNNYVVTF